MDNGKICYQTKEICKVREEWQIKLEVISDAFEMSFTSKKDFNKYVNEQTQIIMKQEEDRYKAKLKEYYKKQKKHLTKQ